mgnify:CR=1 FL=1
MASLSIARGCPTGYRFAQIIGAGHGIWILFQLHWFDQTSLLQPILATVGMSIVMTAELCLSNKARAHP